MEKFKIVEKKNPLAVHGLFYTRDRAERHLNEIIPEYVRRGYFMDKTLQADDFIIRDIYVVGKALKSGGKEI